MDLEMGRAEFCAETVRSTLKGTRLPRCEGMPSPLPPPNRRPPAGPICLQITVHAGFVFGVASEHRPRPFQKALLAP